VTTAQPAERVRTALLEARGIVKTYRRGPEEVHALRDVSFLLFPHEVVGLVGPSGSGKSTLLNVLCGWEELDAGSIEWAGPGPPVAPIDRRWADISVLPQRLGLIEELTVWENVELPVRLCRQRVSSERVETLLEALGLAGLARRPPAEISIGEQQRAALARALVLQPRLLLADEPTGHQDEESAKAVFGAIRRAAGDGTACVVATHNREFVAFADRVLAIRDGRVRPEPTSEGPGA
jgi:putative ABC transport system ATP-binding protein